MLQTAGSPARPRVPPLIKRNTALVALSQSFSGAGMPLAYGIGPLMVVAITGSASLAGLSVGLFGLSRFLVSYPVGKVTDAYGRKPGIQLGLAIALIGALTVAWSMSLQEHRGARRRPAHFRHGHGGRASASRRRHRHVPAVAAGRGARLSRPRIDRGPRAQPDPGGDGRAHRARSRPGPAGAAVAACCRS